MAERRRPVRPCAHFTPFSLPILDLIWTPPSPWLPRRRGSEVNSSTEAILQIEEFQVDKMNLSPDVYTGNEAYH